MVTPYSNKIADDISAFVASDNWRIVKYRLLVQFKDALQKHVNSAVKNNSIVNAAIAYGKVEALEEIVKITERLGDELRKGKLDADVALSVIENKQRTTKE